MHKLVVVILDQAQRFRIEIERIALLVDRIHALKQLGIEVDRILVRGQLRRLDLLDLLQLRVDVRAGRRRRTPA